MSATQAQTTLRDGSAQTPGRMRVLIVDDEQDILAEMRELLEGKGFSVEVAASAADALGHLTADPELNTIVSDIRMPLVDGVEMIDRATSDPALRDRPLRFIMVTGHATLADAQRSIRARAVDFVPKPIDTRQLLRAIERAGEQIAEIRAEQRQQALLAAKMEAERRQRLEVSAQNVTLEALVAAARTAANGTAAGVGAALTRLGEVLRRTVDCDRHRGVAAGGADVATFGTFLAQAAAQIGLSISDPGSAAEKPRRVPSATVEDAVEALLLGLKLRGAAKLALSADADAGRSGLRLLPEEHLDGIGSAAADPFAAEAAQLAFLAAEISIGRIGGRMSIEDVDADRQAVVIAFPVSPDGH